ncbi:MAG: hypothetical protein RLZZ191_1142 [Pseudomonadota bacterium]
MKVIKKIFKNENGATAIEYGLIASLIAVAAITAMTSLGTKLTGTSRLFFMTIVCTSLFSNSFTICNLWFTNVCFNFKFALHTIY